jgi:hypothetical protein
MFRNQKFILMTAVKTCSQLILSKQATYFWYNLCIEFDFLNRSQSWWILPSQKTWTIDQFLDSFDWHNTNDVHYMYWSIWPPWLRHPTTLASLTVYHIHVQVLVTKSSIISLLINVMTSYIQSAPKTTSPKPQSSKNH